MKNIFYLNCFILLTLPLLFGSAYGQDVDFSVRLVPEMGDKFEIVAYYKNTEVPEGAVDAEGNPIQSVLMPAEFTGKTDIKIEYISHNFYKTNFQGMYLKFDNTDKLQNPAKGILYGDKEGGYFWEEPGTLKKKGCLNMTRRGL